MSPDEPSRSTNNPTPPDDANVPMDVEARFHWLTHRPKGASVMAMRDKTTGQPRYLLFNIEPEEGGVGRFYLIGELFTTPRTQELMQTIEPFPHTLELVERTDIPEAFNRD
jgi:hypothetical protein